MHLKVLPQLRAMPNLLVIRPANLEEIVGSFEVFGAQYAAPRGIHQYVDPKPLVRRPVFLMTSRGELGLPYKGNTAITGQVGVQKGAYVLHECFDAPAVQQANGISHEGFTHVNPLPDIVLIASGQEVALVMRAKEILLQLSRKFNTQLQAALAGLPPCLSAQTPQILKVRIVSMPCWELFDEQDQDYQDAVLLSNFSDILRIYVEKAATKNTGHDKYAHVSVLMPSYGLLGKVLTSSASWNSHQTSLQPRSGQNGWRGGATRARQVTRQIRTCRPGYRVWEAVLDGTNGATAKVATPRRFGGKPLSYDSAKPQSSFVGHQEAAKQQNGAAKKQP